MIEWSKSGTGKRIRIEGGVEVRLRWFLNTPERVGWAAFVQSHVNAHGVEEMLLAIVKAMTGEPQRFVWPDGVQLRLPVLPVGRCPEVWTSGYGGAMKCRELMAVYAWQVLSPGRREWVGQVRGRVEAFPSRSGVGESGRMYLAAVFDEWTPVPEVGGFEVRVPNAKARTLGEAVADCRAWREAQGVKVYKL